MQYFFCFLMKLFFKTCLKTTITPRIGLRVGSMIAEREFERALIFCGTGMGIHIAASKCPHVHAGVVESVPAALRAITGNGVNVLAMGAMMWVGGLI